MSPRSQDFDAQVRQLVYRCFADQGRAPSIEHVAGALALPPAEVVAAFERLAAARALVLQRASREVLMAMPFSAVPTAFRVVAGDRAWWGNCIWDALGVLAAVGRDGSVETSCADCGDELVVEVTSGRPRRLASIAQFIVPARRWWDDVVFT